MLTTGTHTLEALSQTDSGYWLCGYEKIKTWAGQGRNPDSGWVEPRTWGGLRDCCQQLPEGAGGVKTRIGGKSFSEAVRTLSPRSFPFSPVCCFSLLSRGPEVCGLKRQSGDLRLGDPRLMWRQRPRYKRAQWSLPADMGLGLLPTAEVPSNQESLRLPSSPRHWLESGGPRLWGQVDPTALLSVCLLSSMIFFNLMFLTVCLTLWIWETRRIFILQGCCEGLGRRWGKN